MAKEYDILNTSTMPVIALRGLTVFPNVLIHFEVAREASVRALEAAMTAGTPVFLVGQKDIAVEEPGLDDLYQVGTLSNIRQILRMPGDNVRVMVEGQARGRLLQLMRTEPYLEAEVREIPVPEAPARSGAKIEALMRATYELFQDYAELAPKLSDKLVRELTIVYETCALPEERLYVSWSATGAGGEEQRPSYLVRRLEHLFPQANEVREAALDGTFRLSAPRPALELAGRYPAAAEALLSLPEYAPLAKRVLASARFRRGSLSRPAVDILYGRRASMSASRMDKLKSCHFSYFMQYGLKAELRRPAGFQAPEYGSFVHYVLEHVLKEAGTCGGVAGMEKQDLRAMAKAAVERYVTEKDRKSVV